MIISHVIQVTAIIERNCKIEVKRAVLKDTHTVMIYVLFYFVTPSLMVPSSPLNFHV